MFIPRSLNRFWTNKGLKSCWDRHNSVGSSEDQHMRIVAFGKWIIGSFTRWQSKKTPSYSSNNGKKKSCQFQLRFHTETELRRADSVPSVKEDQMTGQRCFQPWGFWFLIFQEDGKRRAEVQMLRFVVLHWRFICVHSFSLYLLRLCKVGPAAGLCLFLYLLFSLGLPLQRV